MFYIVYKTTNLVNGKYYIGIHSTNDIGDKYLGSGKRLLAAIRKYGTTSFKRENIFVFDNKQEMLNKEQEIVTEDFCKQTDVYNLCLGGGGGFQHTQESKRKIKEAAKARPPRVVTDQTRRNLSQAQLKKYSTDMEYLNKRKRPCPDSIKHKIAVTLIRKELKRKLIYCIHCGRNIPINMYNRWHGNKCAGVV